VARLFPALNCSRNEFSLHLGSFCRSIIVCQQCEAQNWCPQRAAAAAKRETIFVRARVHEMLGATICCHLQSKLLSISRIANTEGVENEQKPHITQML